MFNRYLYFTVFCTGAIILALELTASRLLAPYFGASLFVWANVIGIVLIALSIGYELGGRIADKRPEAEVLYRIVLVAGLIVAGTQAISRPILESVGQALQNLQVLVVAGSFISVIVLLAIPLLLLGMMSPFAVRLVNREVSTTGRSAGSLYAFSTVGSIAGTFLTAFVLLPYVGVQETIFGCALLLVLLGITGSRLRKALWPLLLVPVAAYALQIVVRQDDPRVVFEKDSFYQHVRVIDEGGIKYLVHNEGMGVQSVYDPKNPLTGAYWDFMGVVGALRPVQKKKVLVLGLAGGTIPRLYHEVLGSQYDLEMTGVEIDPVVYAAARKEMALDNLPLEVIIGDGRMALQKSEASYDVILADAYSN